MDMDSIDILISVVFGVVIGFILYRSCIKPTIVKGPNSRDIIDKVYVVDGKKYILEPVVCGSLFKS